MVTEPAGKSAQQQQSDMGALLEKARLLVDKLRELTARNDRLERRVKSQDAVIEELRGRLRDTEERKAKAKEILKQIANQLPADR